MAADAPTLELKLVRPGDGIEVDLRPLQGLWTEEQYLTLSDQLNYLVEYDAGRIELLPMPTSRHQAILLWLYGQFLVTVGAGGGRVLVAPLRLQVSPGTFREPDILMLFDGADPRYQDAFWLGADLVVEVVSPADQVRDLVVKPLDYAAAGIPEYWIVNPIDETITVLVLDGEAYSAHGMFRRGDRATSKSLLNFAVIVDDAFDAGGEGRADQVR